MGLKAQVLRNDETICECEQHCVRACCGELHWSGSEELHFGHMGTLPDVYVLCTTCNAPSAPVPALSRHSPLRQHTRCCPPFSLAFMMQPSCSVWPCLAGASESRAMDDKLITNYMRRLSIDSYKHLTASCRAQLTGCAIRPVPDYLFHNIHFNPMRYFITVTQD